MRQTSKFERTMRWALCAMAETKRPQRASSRAHARTKNVQGTPRVRETCRRQRALRWALPTAQTRERTHPASRSNHNKRPAGSTSSLRPRGQTRGMLVMDQRTGRQGVWVNLHSWQQKTRSARCCLGAGKREKAPSWEGGSTLLRHTPVHQSRPPSVRNTRGQCSRLHCPRSTQYPRRATQDEAPHPGGAVRHLQPPPAGAESRRTGRSVRMLTSDHQSNRQRDRVLTTQRIGSQPWQ